MQNPSQKLEVLYEDNHLIAVYKPAGVLVQAGDSRRDVGRSSIPVPILMDMVKTYLKETYKKEGNVFLGLIHRLDRNVGGVVLFAKTSKGASRLSEQFRLHSVEKIYHAWVEGIPKQKKGTLINFLHLNERSNTTAVFDDERDAPAGSDRAELSYEVVKTEGDGTNSKSLLKIILQTGRHHQIRAQLSHIGHPILGDVKYGAAKPFADQHLALYATELHFDTATTGERKIISIPIENVLT